MLKKLGIQTVEEVIAEHEIDRNKFIQSALSGKATWGGWRYNPDNLTLEIDSKISRYPKDNPYYVDLEQCNNSKGILDSLVQLLGKAWCPKEQVGYLLQAIADLSGDIYQVIWSRKYNLSKHLKEMRSQSDKKLLTVDEVAKALRVNKITVYRMIKADKLKVIRLPGSRFPKIRITDSEVKSLINK
jgi:excisionase family DNA binding protein